MYARIHALMVPVQARDAAPTLTVGPVGLSLRVAVAGVLSLTGIVAYVGLMLNSVKSRLLTVIARLNWCLFP